MLCNTYCNLFSLFSWNARYKIMDKLICRPAKLNLMINAREQPKMAYVNLKKKNQSVIVYE